MFNREYIKEINFEEELKIVNMNLRGGFKNKIKYLENLMIAKKMQIIMKTEAKLKEKDSNGVLINYNEII